MSLKVLEPQQTDLELSQMAQLSGIQGTQFGKVVYMSTIKFKDLDLFMTSFPEVQRKINPRKVSSIMRYILSGLEENDKPNMRFFSSMTVTSRGPIFYVESLLRIAIDTKRSKLSINDGQHRAAAINMAFASLENEYVKSKDKLKSARIRAKIDALSEMSIPVIIFSGMSRIEEKQLFFDLNNLAGRPSKNANIRLNQTDLFSRMARELAEENRYLAHYGVEQDKQSVTGDNENTILLATVHTMIKELLGNEYTFDSQFLNEENYEKYKKEVNEVLDKLFFTLPNDIDMKGFYLTDKSFTLKSIARFITHARNHLDLRLTDDEIFKIIGEMDWKMNLDFWSKYGATASKSERNIVFPGGGHGGQKAVYDALIDKATQV